MTSVFYPYLYDAYQVRDIDAWVKNLLATPPGRVICIWSIEYVSPEKLQLLKQAVDQAAPPNPVIWVVLIGNYVPGSLDGADVRLINLDLVEFYVYHQAGFQDCNLHWNSHTNRFLFLSGKAHHANRLRLLYKYQQQGLLDRCIWSLYSNPQIARWGRHLLPELDDQEYQLFLDDHVRTVEGIPILEHNGYIDLMPMPWDNSMYHDTSFRVIPETQSDGGCGTTEKAFFCMLNHHPYMMIGHPGSLKFLQQQGYRTFTQYLPRSNYDDIEDTEQRLDAVVENTQYWLENIHRHQDEIQQDIEHNAALVWQHLDASLKAIDQLLKEFDWPGLSRSRCLPMWPARSSWQRFYYGIKDPAWPDCDVELGFRNLPLEIQQECCEVFGYKPRF